MRLRWIQILAISLLSACGANQPLTWPAQIPSIEGIEGDSLTWVQDKIVDLNTEIGSPVLTVGPGSGSPIYIRKVEDFGNVAGFTHLGDLHLDQNEFAYIRVPGVRGTLGTSRIAGRATLTSQQCTIELASFLMKPESKDLLHPVLWHEIGHCAGLPHVSEEGEMMSPLTLPISRYSSEHLTRFFAAFMAAIQKP